MVEVNRENSKIQKSKVLDFQWVRRLEKHTHTEDFKSPVSTDSTTAADETILI
jgi:hypothetical protein